MSSIIIGTAPEGMDLSENKTPSNNAAVGVVMGIATAFVALRFWARSMSTKAGIGYDDWFLLVALV